MATQVLDMPPRELALLQALMARPGRAMAKEKLFELVFPGAQDVQYEAIEVVAYRLRKRLTGTGVQLVTLRGLGYLLVRQGRASGGTRLAAGDSRETAGVHAPAAAAEHPAAGADAGGAEHLQPVPRNPVGRQHRL
jgi:DNA-binding winged helix-turn-helix (wHTH) protein